MYLISHQKTCKTSVLFQSFSLRSEIAPWHEDRLLLKMGKLQNILFPKISSLPNLVLFNKYLIFCYFVTVRRIRRLTSSLPILCMPRAYSHSITLRPLAPVWPDFLPNVYKRYPKTISLDFDTYKNCLEMWEIWAN